MYCIFTSRAQQFCIFNTNLSEPIIATPIGFSSCMYASLSPGKITFSANCAELYNNS